MENKDLISIFIGLLGQLKVFHWQTKSYARHIAYERVYNALDKHIDDFIEAYQGRYGIRLQVSSEIKLLNVQSDEVNGFISSYVDFLVNDLNEMLDESDVDLFTIRDEMVKEFNILKYLLTLK